MRHRFSFIAVAGAATAAAVTAALVTIGAPHRSGPATRSGTHAGTHAGPEQAAAAFTVAFLTYRWDDPPGQLRRRCRPWDTDAVDAALGAPGLPPDRDRRAAGRETDDVTIRAVNPQDRAADHLDASVAAIVTLQRPGQTGRTLPAATEFLDVRVVATATGWVVAQVSQ